MSIANYAALKAALFTWVTSVTGWDGTRVIWSHGNAPRPDLDYLSLEILTQDTRGTGISVVDTDGNATPYSWDVVSVRFQGFGDDGWDKLNALRLALLGTTHREALNAAGLTRRGPVPPLQRVPAIVGTKFEERAVATFRFGIVATSASTEVGLVDNVSVTVSVYDETPSVVYTETFTAEEGD